MLFYCYAESRFTSWIIAFIFERHLLKSTLLSPWPGLTLPLRGCCGYLLHGFKVHHLPTVEPKGKLLSSEGHRHCADMLEYCALQGAVLHAYHLMPSLMLHSCANLKDCCVGLLGLILATCQHLNARSSLWFHLSPWVSWKWCCSMHALLTTRLWFYPILLQNKNWTLCALLKHGTKSLMVFFLMNLLPPATDYLISRDRLVEVRGIVVLHNQQYSMSPMAVPQFNSFECLVLNVSAPLTTAIASLQASKDKLRLFIKICRYGMSVVPQIWENLDPGWL